MSPRQRFSPNAAHQTTSRSVRCKLCPLVAKLSFWGPRPERKWKRPGLFIASVLIAALSAFVFVTRVSDFAPTYALFAVLFVVGVFGITVSVFGCNACVARAFGDL